MRPAGFAIGNKMSARRIMLGLALMIAGCGKAAPPPAASAPPAAPPSPGLSVAQLQIIAEPKEGLPDDSAQAGEYVTAVMEKVDYANLPDIVVWLEPSGGNSFDASKFAAAPIDVDPQHAAGGIAAAVSVGQQIVLHNTSPAPAHLYSVSDGNDFDLGKVAPGADASYTIKSAGLIEVLTDSLLDPVAKIYAAPTAWVRLTAAGKTVEFRDLPPGQYKAVTWHPRLPGREMPITLSADQVTTAVAKVGVNDLPKISAR